MLTYQAGALSGFAAYDATVSQGRSITISVKTSTATGTSAFAAILSLAALAGYVEDPSRGDDVDRFRNAYPGGRRSKGFIATVKLKGTRVGL